MSICSNLCLLNISPSIDTSIVGICNKNVNNSNVISFFSTCIDFINCGVAASINVKIVTNDTPFPSRLSCPFTSLTINSFTLATVYCAIKIGSNRGVEYIADNLDPVRSILSKFLLKSEKSRLIVNDPNNSRLKLYFLLVNNLFKI